MGQLAKFLKLAVARTTGFITPGTVGEREQIVQKEVRKILDGFMDSHLRAIGKKVWCDKTPQNVNDLKEIEWAFPDARYICLYRNGLDVAQSGLQMPEKGPMWWASPYVAKHPESYLAALLENWVEKTEAMVSFEAGNPRVCPIKYEDLVEDPRKALDPVFRFLGMSWDHALLERVFRTPHDPGGGDNEITATNRIEKDRVGKGRRLDPSLLAQVPRRLLERQKALDAVLGYSRPGGEG